MTATTAPPLAKQVLFVDGNRSHYYRLPELKIAQVLAEQGEKELVVETNEYGEFEQYRSKVFCVDYSDDAEKAITLRDEFQLALDELAETLSGMVRYDKALAEAIDPKNPLTPTIIAAEDPESGKSIDPTTWKQLKTDQEDWLFLPVERIAVTCYAEGQGLVTEGGVIPPQNAFTCESDEEWAIVKELSDVVEQKQKKFLGHLRSLETYSVRQSRSEVVDEPQPEVIDVEVVTDEEANTALSVSSEASDDDIATFVSSLTGFGKKEQERIQRVLIDLEVNNRQLEYPSAEVEALGEDREEEEEEFIPDEKEEVCKAVLSFIVLSEQKLNEALWTLKYKIFGERGKSRKYGSFSSICRRLYELGVLRIKETTAIECALSHEEHRQLVAAKVIAPSQQLSIAALLAIRQLPTIEAKKAAVEYAIEHNNGAITRDAIKEYRNQIKPSNKSSSGTGDGTSSAIASPPAAPTQSPPSPRDNGATSTPTTPSTPNEIIGVASRSEIQENDLVETLPGAKYIGNKKEIPAGTKGMIQSVNDPVKQGHFIPRDNPNEGGYILLENLKKIVVPSQTNYTQIVADTSQEGRSQQLIAELKGEIEALRKQNEELTKRQEQEAKRNAMLEWRFAEWAADPKNINARVILGQASVLQRYEKEFEQIKDLHPEVMKMIDESWAVLRDAAFDPVEDAVTARTWQEILASKAPA
jgi:hypothetical protein